MSIKLIFTSTTQPQYRPRPKRAQNRAGDPASAASEISHTPKGISLSKSSPTASNSSRPPGWARYAATLRKPRDLSISPTAARMAATVVSGLVAIDLSEPGNQPRLKKTHPTFPERALGMKSAMFSWPALKNSHLSDNPFFSKSPRERLTASGWMKSEAKRS